MCVGHIKLLLGGIKHAWHREGGAVEEQRGCWEVMGEDETDGWNQGHHQDLGGPLEGVRTSEHDAFINVLLML